MTAHNHLYIPVLDNLILSLAYAGSRLGVHTYVQAQHPHTWTNPFNIQTTGTQSTADYNALIIYLSLMKEAKLKKIHTVVPNMEISRPAKNKNHSLVLWGRERCLCLRSLVSVYQQHSWAGASCSQNWVTGMLLLKPLPWEDINNVLYLRSPRQTSSTMGKTIHSGEPLSSLGLQSNGWRVMVWCVGDLKTATLKVCIQSGWWLPHDCTKFLPSPSISIYFLRAPPDPSHKAVCD